MAAKILLVEDDNNLREIYEARLQAEGYDLAAARDGEEALVVAKTERPDLVISDVMMPKISGFEMLDILRNTEGMQHVKVIMLTALGQSEDQKRADSLGADRYLVKSQVTLEDIVNVSHQLLVESGAIVDDAVPEPAIEAPVPSPVAAAEPVTAVPVPVAAEPVVQPAPVTPPPAEPVTLPVTPLPAPVAPAADEVAAPPVAAPAAPVPADPPVAATDVVALPAPEPVAEPAAPPAPAEPVAVSPQPTVPVADPATPMAPSVDAIATDASTETSAQQPVIPVAAPPVSETVEAAPQMPPTPVSTVPIDDATAVPSQPTPPAPAAATVPPAELTAIPVEPAPAPEPPATTPVAATSAPESSPPPAPTDAATSAEEQAEIEQQIQSFVDAQSGDAPMAVEPTATAAASSVEPEVTQPETSPEQEQALNDALADLGGVAPAPAETPPVAAPPQEAAESPATPAEPKPTTAAENETTTHKKVIQPLASSQTEKSLEQLLAEEEAKEAAPTPSPNSVVTPANKDDFDPNSISL